MNKIYETSKKKKNLREENSNKKREENGFVNLFLSVAIVFKILIDQSFSHLDSYHVDELIRYRILCRNE